MSSRDLVKSYTKKRRARKTVKNTPYTPHMGQRMTHTFYHNITNEKGEVVRTLTHKHHHAFDLDAPVEHTNTWTESCTCCALVGTVDGYACTSTCT